MPPQGPKKNADVIPPASTNDLQVTENLKPNTTAPQIYPNPTLHSYTRIHVCQASYGDSLVLDHDPTPPERPTGGSKFKNLFQQRNAELQSSSRTVILIDGGPASISPTGINGPTVKPISNLYLMLQELLPPGANALDTLVVTHDDADHMFGIKQLLRALNYNPALPWFWKRGKLAMSQGKAPFANIWHNSAQNVLKYCYDNNRNGNSDVGYFDAELAVMRNRMQNARNLPYFNQEFRATSLNKPTILKAGHETNRGSLHFTFLGPADLQITKLGIFYDNNGATRGGGDRIIDSFIETSEEVSKKWQHILTELEKSPSNDTSEKNLASIVFSVNGDLPRDELGPVMPFKAIFMGDASAHTVFLGRHWDGTPQDVDVLKVGHHGSFHNNFFGRDVISKIKRQINAFYPNSPLWNAKLPARLKANDEQAETIRNIITYFANIRARKYIISASHDGHPNPHITTLIGIIARAIMFYDEAKGPIEIYITNPIFAQTWAQLFSFWLNVDHIDNSDPNKIAEEKKPLIEDWDDGKEYDIEHMIQMAEGNNNNQGVQEHKMSAAAMADLHFDYAGKYYRFMLLRPERDYGTVHLRQPQLGESGFHWTEINPFGNWNRYYLGQHYQKDIIGDPIADTKTLKADLTKKDKNKTGKGSKKKLDKKEKPVKKTIAENFKTATNEKARQQKKTKRKKDAQAKRKDLNTPMGSDLIAIEGAAKGKRGRGRPPKTMMMMMISTPMLSMSSATMSSVDQTANETAMEAPVPIFSARVITADPSEVSPNIPDPKPLRPRWQNFRKFDVDLFDIPHGDYISDDVKLLRLNAMDEFLYQLVLGDKMTLENALLFDKNGYGTDMPLLGPFLSLLLGRDTADLVAKTLPYNFPTAWDAMATGGASGNALLWELQSFEAIMIDVESFGSGLDGSSGIQQVSMTVSPPGSGSIVWKAPNKYNLLGDGSLTMTIPEGVDLTIYWPTDAKRRIIYGTFEGFVPASKGVPQPVVCEYLVLPDSKRPIRYHVQFADAAFETEGYSMNIVNMLAVFGGLTVDIAAAVVDTVLPGFDAESPFSDMVQLTEPGFVMSRDSMYGVDLRLHRVFGTFTATDTETWRPFSEESATASGIEGFLTQLEIPMPRVQVLLQDLLDKSGPSFFFRIHNSFIFQEVDLAYEIATKPNAVGGKTYEFSFIPQDKDKQKSLSLLKLLETLTFTSVDKDDLPEALTQILDAVSLSCFRIGWNGQLGKPDYVEIGLEIGEINMVEDLLQIDDAMIRLRIDNPSDSATRNIYLQCYGLLEVTDADLAVSFTYGRDPIVAADQKEGKAMDLEINVLKNPLTLGSILEYWFDDTSFLFSPFHSVVKEVGMTRFKFQTGGDTNGKTAVLLTYLELSLKSSRIEILDGLALLYPTLAITGILPFEKDKRVFGVNFEAGVQMNGYTIFVDVFLLFGKEQKYSIELRPTSEGFPVSAFLEFCSQKLASAFDVDLPQEQDFARLRTTYLDGFSIAVVRKEQKSHIQAIEFATSSDLQLCGQKNDTQSRTGGIDFSFAANLTISEKQFTTTVQYGVLSSLNLATENKLVQSQPNGTLNTAPDTPADAPKGWLVSLSYAGEISLLDIASKITGIDLKGGLAKSDLDKVKNTNDITISNFALKLQSYKNIKSICVSADTNWSIFRHVDFAAMLAGSSWGFYLSMIMGSDLLNLLPWDVAHDLAEYFQIDDTVAALYVGQVDPGKAGVKRKIPPRSGGPGATKTQFGLVVTTKITLTEKFGALTKWITKRQLDIYGEISNNGFKLAVALDAIPLGKKPDTDTTAFEVQNASFFIELKRSQLKIGIQANFKIKLPDVTRSDILVQDAAFFLDTTTLGIGLSASIPGPLEDLFGITGFRAKGLSIDIVFSMAEAGLPSAFGMSGAIGLEGAGDVKGDIAFYFAENNPFNSYISGSVENLSVVALIDFFLKDKGLPQVAEQVLKGNVELQKLKFELALDEIYDKHLNKMIHKGFFFEGLLHIKIQGAEWQGYALIEARFPKFQWIMMMSPLHFGDGGTSFFSLTRKPQESTELIPDPVVPVPEGVDANLMTNGPIVFISTEAKDTPLFISVKLTIFSIESYLRIVGNNNTFTAEFHLKAGPGSIDANVELVMKERVRVRGSLSLTLDLLSIPRTLFEGLGKSVELPGKNITGATAAIILDLQVNWPGNTLSLNLSLTPSVNAVGQTWNPFTISVQANVSDIDSLEKIAQKVISEFGANFKNLFNDIMSKLHIDEAARFLKEQWDLGTTEMTKIISIIQNDPDVVNVLNTIRSALNIGLDQVVQTLNDLGVSVEDAIKNAGEEFGRFLGPLIPGGGQGPFPPFSGPFKPIDGPIIPLPSILDIFQSSRVGQIDLPPFMGGEGGGDFPFSGIGILGGGGGDFDSNFSAMDHQPTFALAVHAAEIPAVLDQAEPIQAVTEDQARPAQAIIANEGESMHGVLASQAFQALPGSQEISVTATTARSGAVMATATTDPNRVFAIQPHHDELPVMGLMTQITPALQTKSSSMEVTNAEPTGIATAAGIAAEESETEPPDAATVPTQQPASNIGATGVAISQEDSVRLLRALRKAGYPPVDIYRAVKKVFNGSTDGQIQNCMASAGFGMGTLMDLARAGNGDNDSDKD